ncbi:hypothetical protein CAPTEDRAFT_192341 [Capitella teleta]|uniref:Uncharacterized protein n=1 Tax=Capitella teleta TaxID=283909 RepID=R7UIZ2_CAPTE|nr:hypothetical protein CAPTEDRAFT_192341 [Capitella teleta]|eukprot:ELU03773.1 hypothetical protein CAPTEDRAFT_192341 [Capitella teleta]
MTRQYRPQLDWTPDAKLPTRFAAWKSEIEDEVLLFEVCSGERGKAILSESNAHKEEKDYQVIIKALEQKVKPSNEELSASSKYFYLRQGNATLVDFFKQVTEIVEAMNIDEDPKDKTLRNFRMNGLTSREIYRECLKEKADQLSSKRVMEIASNIEARNLMDEDLSDMANQLLPSNALSRGSPSCVNKIHHENSNDFSNSQLSKSLSCGWCGGRKRCRRQECPAKDSKCNKCGKMGHWGKSDEDDATSVDFDSLNTFPDPKDPHLRPLWFSDPQKSDIHLIEAEVDSGAGCNTFPLYVYKKIFGAAPMDRASVIIKAYGDQPSRSPHIASKGRDTKTSVELNTI